MYDFIPIICGVMILGLGIYMTVNPVGATRKDMREDSKAVDKTKKSGLIMLVLGLIVGILGVARFFLF